jgi:hypothetical protein
MQEFPGLGIYNRGSAARGVLTQSIGVGLRRWFVDIPCEPMPKRWADMLNRIEEEQSLRVRPETSGWIAKFSEHEAD